MKYKIENLQFDSAEIRSICWDGDTLIDWVSGGAKYHLDGSFERSEINYAYRFDAATMSPCGHYAVIYEKLGTKGLILKGGKIVREINRSFYYAHAYEYPIVLFRLPDDLNVIAHCPDDYNRLEIEEIETGRRLTASDKRRPMDFFYSRLSVSPDTTKLLSAGWIWHPLDWIRVIDIPQSLSDPQVLDASGLEPKIKRWDVEISSAAFLDSERIVLATSNDADADEEDDDDEQLQPASVAIYTLSSGSYDSVAQVGQNVGNLMPLGERYVVGLFEHPKIYDINSGEILLEIPEIKTGRQNGSIIHNAGDIPSIALDAENRRIAVADKKGIKIVKFGWETSQAHPPDCGAEA